MTDIAFETAFEPRHGEAVSVAPGVRRITCLNPGPFTGEGTNTYIVGAGSLAVIDPGPDDPAHLDAILRATRGERIARIFVTHTHADHSPLAAALKAATGATTFGYGPHGAGRSGTPAAIRLDAAGDHAFMPDVRLAHGDTVEADGYRLQAVFTPGHTSNHMAYALDGAGVLFAGDHVMAWATSVIAPPDGHMGSYLASLRLLLERDDRLYLPGHGPEKRNPASFVRAYIAHRLMREGAILDAVRAGRDTVPAIVDQVYKGLADKLKPAAGLSTLAHLEHLAENGKVRVDAGGRYAAV
jgi:glyoxylase-like metal-dependent hydrolase (beta-lactamase superfamily II)